LRCKIECKLASELNLLRGAKELNISNSRLKRIGIISYACFAVAGIFQFSISIDEVVNSQLSSLVRPITSSR